MGKNWAITVGINSYNNLQDLKYARNDAEEMRNQLMLLGCEHIYHFTDDKDAPPIQTDKGTLSSYPTYATLRRFLRTRFAHPFLNAGDNLWFFFAGHGRRYEGKDYLMPVDVDPEEVADTAISLHHITERLKGSGADNVILFLDACRSSEISRGGLGIGNDRQKGVITFFSCSPDQSSYEIDDLKHGSFTYALLDILKLKGKTCATVEKLSQRLAEEVPKLNKRYGKPYQYPYENIEPLIKSRLILLPKQATPADIESLRLCAANAEIDGNFTLAKQFWIRVLAADPDDSTGIASIERLVYSTHLSKTEESQMPVSVSNNNRVDIDGQDFSQAEKTKAIEKGVDKVTTSTLTFDIVTLDASGKKSQQYEGNAEYYREVISNSVSIPMIKIPGGDFLMGSPNSEMGRRHRESPQHYVSVSGFWMSMHPITQKQWRSAVSLFKKKYSPRVIPDDIKGNPSRFSGDELPVERVSWNDTVNFCSRLSRISGREYRLPSESEWEYACRAGTNTPFHFGETITSDVANYDSSCPYAKESEGLYRGITTNVDEFGCANAFGLHGMHGNVWEWCSDHFHRDYTKAPGDGSSWQKKGNTMLSQRILRGGSWFHLSRDCRSAFRHADRQGKKGRTYGFRIVCSSVESSIWSG